MTPTIAMPHVGFIGTGILGTPMVERLLASGVRVTVWNRTASKSAPLADLGAQVASSPRELAKQVELLCLCLTDTNAVHEVVFGEQGIAHSMRAEQLLIDFSSIAPDTTREMASRLHEVCGARWIDAPVSGGVPAARQGTLIVFAGGDEADIARAEPVLRVLAQRVTHMGPNGSGQFTKSCNQQLVACNLMVMAEMLAFARAAGVDATRLPAALAGGFADSLPLQLFGPRMAADIDTPPLGAVGTFLKDIEQVVGLAHETGVPVPVTQAALARYRDAAARHDITREGDASRLVRLPRSGTR